MAPLATYVADTLCYLDERIVVNRFLLYLDVINIEAPVNFSHSSEGNFTWDHVNPSMVDHYEMVLELSGQTRVQRSFTEENRFSLLLPCGSTHTVNLTAISVCGQRSMAVSLEGM